MTLAYGIFYIAFGVVGVALNLAVALVINFDKSMQNATYMFMIQLALSDVEAVIGTILGPGILIMSSANDGSNVFVKIFVYFNTCGLHLSVFMMVLVAMSRWAFFSNHITLNNLFSNRNRKIICIFVWMSLHCWHAPFLFYPGTFTPVGGDSGAFTYTNETISRVISYVDESLRHMSLVTQLIFNGLSIGLVIKMRQQVMTPELRARNSQEIKLLIQCGIDSLVFCVLNVSFIYLMYISQNNDQWLVVIIEVLVLANHIDCAVLYLCFNKKLRSTLIEFLKKRFCMGTHATVAVTPVSVIVQPNGINNA